MDARVMVVLGLFLLVNVQCVVLPFIVRYMRILLFLIEGQPEQKNRYQQEMFFLLIVLMFNTIGIVAVVANLSEVLFE